MIDVHCHILHGVDDGPKDIETSIEMLRMAAGMGTEVIAATAHVNHPINFKPVRTPQEALAELKAYLEQSDLNLKLLQGYEIYIPKHFKAGHFPLSEYTIEGTHTILVEFPPEIKPEEMEEALYEVMLSGLRVIVAHIEYYPYVFKDTAAVKRIKSTGAVIQTTASVFRGKRGTEALQQLNKLIAMGLIDLVATDAHGSQNRRPNLKAAYDYLEGKYGREMAKRLCKENPLAILENRALAISPVSITKQRVAKPMKRLVGVAASVLMIGVLATAAYGLYMNKDKEPMPADALINAAEAENQGSSTTASVPSDSTSENTAPQTAVSLPEVVTQKAEAAAVQAAEEVKNGKSSDVIIEALVVPATQEVTEAELVSSYKKQLIELQGTFEGQLSAMIYSAKTELKATTNDENRKKVMLKYLEIASELEKSSNEQVNRLLYDMQTSLEKNSMPIDSVEVARNTYNVLKKERRIYYLNLLEQP